VPERLCGSDHQEEQPQKKLQDPERNIHTTLSFAIFGTHCERLSEAAAYSVHLGGVAIRAE